MRKFYQIAIVFLATVACLVPTQSRATHAAGGELLYEWNPETSRYKIIFKFYRDCAGAATAPATVTLCYYNTCDNSRYSTTLGSRQAFGSVAVGCPQFPNRCEAPGDPNASPGYEEYWYTAEVDLPIQCENWTFYTFINARNDAITNLQSPGTQLIFVEATLDNLNANMSSSPYFTVKPIPYVCDKMRYSYNNGAVDPNNDSLAFEIIRPRSSGTSCYTGTLPYSAPVIPWNTAQASLLRLPDNPFLTNNTFNLNAETGQCTFIPDGVQNAVITVRANKYREGRKIGSVLRDIQINVLSCDTTSPRFSIDTASFVGLEVNNGRIEACAGTPVSFCYKAVIADTNGKLVLSDNHGEPSRTVGSAVEYTGQATDTAVACFTWTPGFADTGIRVLSISVKDSTCTMSKKVPITQVYSIAFYVYPSTRIITNDTVICSGDNVQLEAAGGTAFHWTILPGGSANSLSCEDCLNPVASPRVTTTYVVTSNNFARCGNTDTITITIPELPYAGPDNEGFLCVGQSKQMNIYYPDGQLGIDYKVVWTPNTGLNNDTITDPVASPTQTTTYTATVTPINRRVTPAVEMTACQWQQSFTITIWENVKLTVNPDTLICPDDTVTLRVSSSTGGPVVWYPTEAMVDSINYTPKAWPTAPQAYYVRSIDDQKCQDTQRVYISVKPRAILFMPDSVTIYPGESYQISPQTNCSYFQWFPAGGLSSDVIANPVAKPEVNTRYYVTGKTEYGCTFSDSIDIFVSLESYIDVPNAFTPGYGENGRFRPVYRGTVALEQFEVYNRWGQKVYETKDISAGWDGKFNGEPQPMGVYVYVVKARTASGRTISKQGNVTMLR